MADDRWFDEDAAQWAADFYPRYLRHTEGEWAGKPFVLSDWQEHDIVRPLFGWKRPDGTRWYRRCIVWVPRKNGKTEFAAGLVPLVMLGDNEWGGQGFSIATVEEQAKIVFDKASTMIGMSEELSERLETFKTSIYCPALHYSFKPLSKTPAGKHGLSMSLLLGDEVHEWADDRLYTFIHQSVAARQQPLEFLISTAGVRQGFGWELWDYCLKVQAGILHEPDLLLVIYCADEEDDWTDEAVWQKANPNLGVSPKWDYLRAEFQKAEQSVRRENDFKRYHLNIWTEQAVRWIALDKWDACSEADRGGALWKELEERLKGRKCFGGLDLSSKIDVTALILVFPPDEDDGQWHVLCRFWVPEDNMQERVRRDRVPYDLWASEGALFTTEGNVVDYRAIKLKIYKDMEQFDVVSIAFDPWNATQVSVELHDEGVSMEEFRQGFASMSAPSKEFERIVLGGLIEHGQHPVLRWMVANVAVRTDPAGNIKPDKEKSTERIDGVVGAIEGIGLATAGEEPKQTIKVPDDYNMMVM